MDGEDFSSQNLRSQWQEDRGGVFRRLAAELRVPPVCPQSCHETRWGSGRDRLGVAGRVRLGGGGLSFLLHPWLGPGAVSDPETEAAAAAPALLRGVEGVRLPP